jgi:hypothetical protein
MLMRRELEQELELQYKKEADKTTDLQIYRQKSLALLVVAGTVAWR